MSFLSLEPALVERLKARLPDGVHVLTRADLAGVTEGSQPTPAVHVIYGGYRVAENGPMTLIEESWMTVVAVRNVRNVASGAGARDEVSTLLNDILDALDGQRLANGFRALRLASPSARPGYTGGYAYFPLFWTTSFTHQRSAESCA